MKKSAQMRARLKAEQGISDMEEPALNMESDGFEVDF